jgi:folate-binding protein YgfZ
MTGVPVAAIEPDSPDAAAVAHYGDPMGEQRKAATTAAVVDRSHRAILTVCGADRLTWLHNMTTQHLTALAQFEGTELLLLSPHGHIEGHAVLTDDGQCSWLDTEAGLASGLLQFLDRMRFLQQVELAEATPDWALYTVLGPQATAAVAGLIDERLAPPTVATVPGPKFASDSVPPRPTTVYHAAALSGGGFVRRMGFGYDLLLPRATAPDVVAALDLPKAGIWAFEALRVADRRPRYGVETDHRTLPAELDWLAAAVHLDKGCYRGQETVARVHHLGRPPRRLVLLHLDGVASDTPPPPGTAVTAGDGRTVGFLGTAVRHYELGMIALAILRRTGLDGPLRVGDFTAMIEPEA